MFKFKLGEAEPPTVRENLIVQNTNLSKISSQVAENLGEKTQTGVLVKTTAGEDQNQYVRYASEISGNNLEFVATLDVENGLWTPDRKHDIAYWREGKTINGKFMPAGYYNDHGFCGASDYYYWYITSDPNFLDPKWQLQKCYELFQGGTKFYGRQRLQTEPKFREEIYSHFILKYD